MNFWSEGYIFKMYSLKDFYKPEKELFVETLKQCFPKEKWLEVFLTSEHHGLLHGEQVRIASLKLIETLTEKEKNDFHKEGAQINPEDPEKSAIAAVQIAAVFHDSGRYNEEGEIKPEEQAKHHERGAEKAKIYCEKLNLNTAIPFITDAVLSHDFQNSRITPNFTPPKTFIGKIIQSADQMGWFHPDSVKRTLEFNKSYKIPFYNPDTTLDERFRWIPNTDKPDVLTVLLCQLYGPTDSKRFGIEAARQKINTYKPLLKENILKIAEEKGVLKEVRQVMEEYEKIKTAKDEF
jgi:HD superfamily phosphodiesterase